MENVRNRLKVKLVWEAYRYVHLASQPTFCGAKVLGPELALIQHTNENVKLKSTIAIGATVLDLSKLTMYSLAYDMFPRYESRFKCTLSIIGGDTDSFFLMARGPVDIYKDLFPAMIEDELLDTSNYPKDHPLYSDKLNSELGCIKDEFKGAVCEEVVM